MTVIPIIVGALGTIPNAWKRDWTYQWKNCDHPDHIKSPGGLIGLVWFYFMAHQLLWGYLSQPPTRQDLTQGQ